MARRRIRGAELEVLDTGGDGPVVAFSHGLLWSHRMFLPQIEALRSTHRCIAWDHRGQGASDVPSGRIVTIEDVTSDAILLLEDLKCGPVHFVGLSMGGFVGMRVAARRPDLVRSLSLLETAPDVEPAANISRYRRLILLARLFGVRGFLADRVLPIMCGRSFLRDPNNAPRVAELRAMLMDNGRSITKAVNGVMERASVVDELAKIRCPVLVLRGTEDAAISEPRSRIVLEHVPQATFVAIGCAGHTSSLEAPEAVTSALQTFLRSMG